MEEKPKITIDDFKKLDLRVGTIRSAEPIPGADKFLKLSVDLGEAAEQQILAGIAPYVEDPNTLIGMQCVFVANMAPRTMRGLESNGMLLAASSPEGGITFIIPARALPPGTVLR